MAYADCMAENLIKSGENCMVTDQLAHAEGSSSYSMWFWKKIIHSPITIKLQCWTHKVTFKTKIFCHLTKFPT